ncbi:Adenosylcobalamin biosynthesis, ATP:cob(I)alamin adenosyltransferase-like protein [Gilbertella persicaria]|uniref:Adenosylcobalamin biosynthesis, ATP:cob(I)alamin adenosyltransferase-like protein n=1 Tax=Gilbertella persicaria TaxID=101096 RepID=UPI00221F5EDE|nr:Adenosylcobalamin biosynthesis, ATP:cob(I)alamin adenosyltransferase-like protein [Gilbertella persicaria]KAI8087728.1 Adenosylcobalamin biosynthesis, ATP:cob(I)alamin adenosyltransferase-like protein [Gilbertella persicaria]
MKIYTKTGDKGTSSLYNGERRNKDDDVFEALGTTDELSSHIGLAMEFLEDYSWGTELIKRLTKIQCLLQDAGSNIATPREQSNESRLVRTAFDPSGTQVDQLETWIDEYDEQLPKLTKFILPSGGKPSACLHVARTVCRRAERRVQPLVRDHLCDESVAIFLNRLSDLLFNAARWASQCQGKQEKIYNKYE